MGNEPSVFEKHGYSQIRKEQGFDLVRTKEGNQYLVRPIKKDVDRVNYLLGSIEHPHVVRHQSFEEFEMLYVLMEYSDGATLAEKLQQEKLSEVEVMDLFVKICMGLSHLHTKDILHKDIKTQNIFFTECGTVCLGELAEITERTCVEINSSGDITNTPPEILRGENYSSESDIWGLGCLLYELCMQKAAFAAESPERLVPKILNATYEKNLLKKFSSDLGQLVSEMLQPEPQKRPSVSEILCQPFVINCLIKLGKKTHAELKESVKKLRALADGLESCHFGTTVASLTGGVIGAAGGVTSIVGLILAPFTLGTSLIVTGVGVGVAVLGGATAGVSNITNVVNQSTDRRNVKNIIIQFQEKMNSLVCCLEHIGRSAKILENTEYSDDCNISFGADGTRVGPRIGRGLGAIPELVRLTRVLSLGRVAAQTARAVRVAEMLGGVFSAFFIAVDIFFIAMDAKEIHNIRQAREEPSTVRTERYTSLNKDDSQSDVTPKQEVKSELMKFVLKIRETADELEKVVDELDIINSISTLVSTGENL